MNGTAKPFSNKSQAMDEKYFRTSTIENFINAFYQIQDVLSLLPHQKILVIGPGLGIETAVLKRMGFFVITLDIDPETKPDFVRSIDDLSFLKDKEFDVVICSHVLEHLPFERFEKILSEIKRISNYTIIYLPIKGLKFLIKIGIPKVDFSFLIYLPIFIFKKYRFNGSHYWEIDTRGCSKKIIRDKISRYFKIIKEYHNKNWRCSYNFVLKSK